MTPRAPHGPAFATTLVAVLVYAAAMGWLEAVIVVYLRDLLHIGRTESIPAADEVHDRLRSIPWLLSTEQSREAATLVMLGAVAWLAGRTAVSRVGAFLAAFGAWDLAYYAGLYALLRWPPTLTTLDLLFLIPPHPLWYQPVWVPASIATVMVVAGAWLLRRGS